MNPISRHKNTVVLAVVLLIQLLALAVQVKRQTAEGPVRVIRLVTVDTIAAFERVLLHSGAGVRGVWANYIDLRDVRRRNVQLEEQDAKMRLQLAKEQEEIRQAHRIQALLGFKEHWIDTTVAAMVIGTSGTETSRLLYLDKGAKDGIRADMAVITPYGVVGKVLAVYGDTAQVLLINDVTSGVGAILEKSRLQGIVKGTPTGGVQLRFIMGDEPVQPGEALVTSGGDRVFPKGLPLGTVAKVSTGRDLFLDIQVKPAVDLDRLEEVLVITEQKARAPDVTGLGPIRASDILAEHLPGVPAPPPTPPTGSTADPEKASPGATAPKGAAPPKAGLPPAPAAPHAAAVQKSAAPGASPGTARAPSSNAGVASAAPKAVAPKVVAPKVVAPKAAAPKPAAPKAAAPKVEDKASSPAPDRAGSKPDSGEGTH